MTRGRTRLLFLSGPRKKETNDMKNVIIKIIVWVVIIGFFAAGVSVMATQPDTLRIQSAEWAAARNLQQMQVERMQPNDEEIRPAGGESRVMDTISGE